MLWNWWIPDQSINLNATGALAKLLVVKSTRVMKTRSVSQDLNATLNHHTQQPMPMRIIIAIFISVLTSYNTNHPNCVHPFPIELLCD